MAEKIACPTCGEQNYPTDRECLSCGAALRSAAPAATATPAPPVQPQTRKTYDDRSWWRRRTDDVVEYQLGGLAGMVVVCLGMAILYGTLTGQFVVAVGAFVFFGIAAYCFVWYVRDPDSIWPLIVCIVLSSLYGWLLIAFGAFAGAAVEKQMARRAA